MPKGSSVKESSIGRASLLTIDHISRDRQKGLYFPAADWRYERNYPELKPEQQLIQCDFLRLAWEVLRRVPRYRWHYQRIRASGFLDSDTFPKREYFLDSEDFDSSFRAGKSWKLIKVGDHICFPDSTEGELLGAYVERNSGAPWRVFHCHGWAKRLWGVSKLMDPDMELTQAQLKALFAPSAPELISSDASDEFYTSRVLAQEAVKTRGSYGIELKTEDLPITYSTVVSSREILVKLRIDMPLHSQAKAVEAIITRAQRKAKLEDMGDKARLTDVGLSSFWLRAWDASEEARAESKRMPQTALISSLRVSAADVPRAVKNTETKRKGGVPVTFGDEMDTALKVGRVSKWLDKAEKYIEGQEDFYRVLLGRAFTS